MPDAMVEEAMEFFWFPEELGKIMKCYNKFQMRFTAGNFTIDW